MLLNFAERQDQALAEAEKARRVDENHWMPLFAISQSLRPSR